MCLHALGYGRPASALIAHLHQRPAATNSDTVSLTISLVHGFVLSMSRVGVLPAGVKLSRIMTLAKRIPPPMIELHFFVFHTPKHSNKRVARGPMVVKKHVVSCTKCI